MNQHIDASKGFFNKTLDELVQFSEYDDELAEGIRWIDSQAQKKGMTFYDMVFEFLYKNDSDISYKEWFNTQN